MSAVVPSCRLTQAADGSPAGFVHCAAGVYAGDPTSVADEFADLYDKLRNPLMHAASFVDDSLEALARLKRQLEVIQQRTVQAETARKSAG
jgi:hypothetical protein